ncbi:hypothetical protein AwEntero_05010 [Enterobacterales bacterium]|nr:hypothetical protein AwEntero_05010 [Enterobacterales bacterium]
MLNCVKMLEIKSDANENKQETYILIPPVSKGYIENLGDDIKTKAKDFLASLESEYFHILDLSADNDFYHTDFRDGHHLNSYGAKKLREKLFNAGMLTHREL